MMRNAFPCTGMQERRLVFFQGQGPEAPMVPEPTETRGETSEPKPEEGANKRKEKVQGTVQSETMRLSSLTEPGSETARANLESMTGDIATRAEKARKNPQPVDGKPDTEASQEWSQEFQKLSPEQRVLLRETSIIDVPPNVQKALISFVQKLPNDLCQRLSKDQPLQQKDFQTLLNLYPALPPEEKDILKSMPVFSGKSQDTLRNNAGKVGEEKAIMELLRQYASSSDVPNGDVRSSVSIGQATAKGERIHGENEGKEDTEPTKEELQERLKTAEEKMKNAKDGSEKFAAFMEFAMLHLAIFKQTMEQATKGTSFEKWFAKKAPQGKEVAPQTVVEGSEPISKRQKRLKMEIKKEGASIGPQGIDALATKKKEGIQANERTMQPSDQEKQAKTQITQFEGAKKQLQAEQDTLLTTVDGKSVENATRRAAITGQIQELDRRITEVRSTMATAKQQRESLEAKNKELQTDIQELEAIKKKYEEMDKVLKQLKQEAWNLHFATHDDALEITLPSIQGEQMKITIDMLGSDFEPVLNISNLTNPEILNQGALKQWRKVGEGKYTTSIEELGKMVTESQKEKMKEKAA